MNEYFENYFERKQDEGDLSERLKAVLEQLDQAVAEYRFSKSDLDTANVRFDMALQHITGAKQRASEMMSSLDWYAWGAAHPEVRYTGTAIGDGIRSVLENAATTAATKYVEQEGLTFWPYMSLDGIADELEKGGYEFRSATPKREANAALINLQGIVKTDAIPNSLFYTIENIDELLEQAQKRKQQKEAAAASSEAGPAGES